MTQRNVFRIIIMTVALLAGVAIIAYANQVFLLAFGAIIVSLAFGIVADLIHRYTKLPYSLSLMLVLIVIVGLIVLGFYLYAPLISQQFYELVETIPASIEELEKLLNKFINIEKFKHTKLVDLLTSPAFLAELPKALALTGGAIVTIILLFLIGIYIAFNPSFYIKTVLRILPQDKRERTVQFFRETKTILQWWILSKAISMTLIGMLSFIVLHFLHIKFSLILGLLAGILAFIPYLGAILAAIPAILIALTVSPMTALYVAIAYTGIHALDAYIVSPYLEMRTVYLPPGITILMQMLLAVLCGILGFALASPITVVMIAFIEHLYRGRKIA